MNKTLLALGAAALGMSLAACGVLSPQSSASNNITCHRQITQIVNGKPVTRYELCVSNGSTVVYHFVPYAVWRTAKTGGYYDPGSGHVYSSVNEDPHPPAEEAPVENHPVVDHPVVHGGE